MALFVEILKLLLWLIVTNLFNVLRAIVWRIRGISVKLKQASTLYKNSVQVKKVWFRYTFDEVAFILNETCFLSTHDKFVDPEYVLRDDVTLCEITAREALFVQSSQDVFDPKNGCFLCIAQFRCAERLLTMPMHSFNQLANTLPDPHKLICIGNTTRCGSTLLGQVFQYGGGCRCFSEPKVCNSMHLLGMKMEAETHRMLMKNTLKILCKPLQNVQSGKPTVDVIKFPGLTAPVLGSINSIYPDAHLLFLYREFLPTLKSSNKSMVSLPVLRVVGFVCCAFPSLASMLVESMIGVPDGEAAPQLKVSTVSQVSAYIVGKAVSAYLQLHSSGVPIHALKYDDIMDDPIGQFKRILEFVGLSLDEDKTKAVLHTDSQENTLLSRKVFSKVNQEVITPDIRAKIKCTWEALGVPYDLENVRLPGTITE